MKSRLLATSCLALTAMALGTAKPASAASPFSWTGCYIGAHVGGGTMTSGGFINNFEGPGFNNFLNGRGAVAGGQGGCNYQDGSWVIGAEVEGYWSGISINNSNKSLNSNGLVNSSFGDTINNTSDFTLAVRAGYTFDRTLLYAKGGWAFGAFNASTTTSCCGNNPNIFTGTTSGNLNGFLVGLGVEHALTRNWTVKLEYNYIAFGAKELPLTACSNIVGNTCALVSSNPLSASKQIVKVGANYLFNLPGAPPPP